VSLHFLIYRTSFNVLLTRPEKKFSLYSRFTIQVETESEAHRIVRKFHMTDFQKVESAPPIRAEIIY